MSINALVFAGGGGKGAYQIGVWEALRELGYDKEFNIVVGTSVGALNSALFSQGDLGIAKNVWRNISHEKILTSKDPKNISLFSQTGLRSIISVNIVPEKIRNSKVTCYVCATDSTSAFTDDQYLSKYFMINALDDETMYNSLLASAALPVAFDSVTINGKTYRDGGMISCHNIPYRKAISLGAGKVIVIDLSMGVNQIKKISGTDVLFLYPSENLGELFDGVIDFSPEGAVHRMSLGRSDTYRSKKLIESFMGEKQKCGFNITKADIDRIIRGK